MSWVCGNCGEEASRGKVSFDDKGRPIRERCTNCAPEEFWEVPFRAPSDNKIYSGPQAMPNLYKLGKDDVYHAKDELLQDTVDLWDEGPTARAIREKRATRRTEPLTAEEQAQTEKWAREVLRPAIAKNGIAGAVEALRNG